jgi:Fur family ferric uptake transcriptional regulator/Fur family peroxide stress response transcriptional regulator
MLTIDEKNLCFDGNLSPHAHFLCKKCGKIYDVMHREEFSQETKEIANVSEHKITEIHYYYKGICKNCL